MSIRFLKSAHYSGMRLVYLPTYSPDYDPIEEGFSSIKAWLCANRDYVLGELTGEETCNLYAMLWQAVYSINADKAYGWFHNSGYL